MTMKIIPNFEQCAWLCTVLLLEDDLKVQLTEETYGWIKTIQEDPQAMIEFQTTADRLTQPNEFGFTELSEGEAIRAKQLIWLSPLNPKVD